MRETDAASLVADIAPFGASTGFALAAIFGPNMDPFDLQRVEVLRGPQGALYDEMSLGGVVNFVTNAQHHSVRRPSARRRRRRGLQHLGRRRPGRGHIPVIQDKPALRVSGFYMKNNADFVDARTGRTGLNCTSHIGGRASLLFKLIDDLTITLTAMTNSGQTPHIGYVDGNALTLQPIYNDHTGYGYAVGSFSVHCNICQGKTEYAWPGGYTLTSASACSFFDGHLVSDYTTIFKPALGALGARQKRPDPEIGPCLQCEAAGLA